MRVRFLMAVMFMTVVGHKAFAQAEIDRIAKELEQKGVVCDKVVNRNPSTKKIINEVRSYVFRSKDGNYARQLKQAFAKEEENSTTAITEKGGRSLTLVFDTDDSHKVYTLEIGNETPDPKVELNIIYKEGKMKVRKMFTPNIDGFDMQQFSIDLDEFGLKMDSFNFDVEKFREEAEKWKERYLEQKKKVRLIAN